MSHQSVLDELMGAPLSSQDIYNWMWTTAVSDEAFLVVCPNGDESSWMRDAGTLPDAISEACEYLARMIEIDRCLVLWVLNGEHQLMPDAFHPSQPGYGKQPNKCTGCCAEWHGDSGWI